MEIQFDDDSISIQLSRREAERLGVAIAAGFETVSRAEYFIRTGLSQPVVQEISDALSSLSPPSTPMFIELSLGIEEVENPRRPRPPQ